MNKRELRLKQMAELIRVEKSMKSIELAAHFGVSTVTIRKDLDELANRGLVIRGIGEVIPDQSTHLEQAFHLRAQQNIQEKLLVGRISASLIKPGDSVILDAGSTTLEIVRNLNVHPLTLLTPALNIALTAGSIQGVTVIIPGGGSLDPIALALDGSEIVESFSRLRADKFFLALKAIDLEKGYTDTNIHRIRIKQAMMQAARETIVVADSSKFGTTSIFQIAPLNAVQKIVTDPGIKPDMIQHLQDVGLQVITAPL